MQLKHIRFSFLLLAFSFLAACSKPNVSEAKIDFEEGFGGAMNVPLGNFWGPRNFRGAYEQEMSENQFYANLQNQFAVLEVHLNLVDGRNQGDSVHVTSDGNVFVRSTRPERVFYAYVGTLASSTTQQFMQHARAAEAITASSGRPMRNTFDCATNQGQTSWYERVWEVYSQHVAKVYKDGQSLCQAEFAPPTQDVVTVIRWLSYLLQYTKQ